MLEKKNYTFGKRFLQFLTKFFWHFKQQPVPNYSCINQKRSSLSKKSIKKSGSKSVHRRSSFDSYYIRSQYPARYRTCSMRERTSTLTSIQEE